MSRESQISPLLWTEYIVFWMCGGRRRRAVCATALLSMRGEWQALPQGYERHL